MNNIRGVVRLETIDGKLIFEKENMIVDNGRKYLVNLIHNKIAGTSSEARKIATLRFGSGTGITQNSDNALNTVISAFDTTITSVNTVILGSSEPIGIKVTVNKVGTTEATNPQMISEMGLFLDGSGTQMFSRLIFEPVPFTQDTTYKLTYFIYF